MELGAGVTVNQEGVIDIVSDHNMLVVECMLNGREERKVKMKKKKWRLRDADWESFQVELSENRWEHEDLPGVNEMNERFTENVRSAAVRQIGYVRPSMRKRVNTAWWNDDIKDARRERKRLS